MKTTDVYFNITEKPVKTNHITWYVEEIEDEITLKEVVKNWYPHPQAPEHSFVTVIELNIIRTEKVTSREAAPLFLLKHALETIDVVQRKENENKKNIESMTLQCGKCGKLLTDDNQWKLVIPQPISEWDIEHKVLRDIVYICCGKIRMKGYDSSLVEYNIPCSYEPVRKAQVA